MKQPTLECLRRHLDKGEILYQKLKAKQGVNPPKLSAYQKKKNKEKSLIAYYDRKI